MCVWRGEVGVGGRKEDDVDINIKIIIVRKRKLCVYSQAEPVHPSGTANLETYQKSRRQK
jgi:hypothetical protein